MNIELGKFLKWPRTIVVLFGVCAGPFDKQLAEVTLKSANRSKFCEYVWHDCLIV